MAVINYTRPRVVLPFLGYVGKLNFVRKCLMYLYIYIYTHIRRQSTIITIIPYYYTIIARVCAQVTRMHVIKHRKERRGKINTLREEHRRVNLQSELAAKPVFARTISSDDPPRRDLRNLATFTSVLITPSTDVGISITRDYRISPFRCGRFASRDLAQRHE